MPNNSFELDTTCPFSTSQIYFANPWFQPHNFNGNTTNSSSSDIFNICDSLGSMGIPHNDIGYQFPHTGLGYAGVIVYADTFNYREYIEVPLLSPLIANDSYCVQFYVSPSDSMGASISNFGAYFSIDSLLDGTPYHAIDYITPQIENPSNNMLNDMINWTLVSGSFTATGGEKFITIGNFHNVANTNMESTIRNANVAYYFIDDVSVIDCTGVGVEEKNKEDVMEVYPNPATNRITIKTKQLNKATLNITNVLGELVYTANITNTNTAIDISTYPKGVYFVNVKSDTQSMNRKFVKE